MPPELTGRCPVHRRSVAKPSGYLTAYQDTVERLLWEHLPADTVLVACSRTTSRSRTAGGRRCSVV